MAGTNETGEDHILLFDGVCNLCNAYVRFFIKRDPRKQFRFASLQSETGQSILKEHRLPTDYLGSIVFAECGRAHLNSSAILRACGYLRFPWPLAKAFLLFPRPLRDIVYNWIARNRYRWFGKMEECSLPDPEDTDRFL